MKDCGDRFPALSALAFSQDFNGFDSFKSFAFGLCITTNPSWPVSLLTVLALMVSIDLSTPPDSDLFWLPRFTFSLFLQP